MAKEGSKADMLDRSARNLVPALEAAAVAARGDCRPADAALFYAAMSLFGEFVEELELEDADGESPEVKVPAKKAAAHRHKYSDGGVCLLEVGGKICGAEARRKKAAPPAPEPAAPEAPAEGGSAP